MTEREYYRESNGAPAEGRREVYQETVVDGTGTAAPGGVARDVYQERVVTPGSDQVVRSERVSVPSEATVRAAMVTRINQIIYFVFGAINALLLIRFAFLLLGANEASPFVSFIYRLSQPFVYPFLGIFGEPAFNGSVIEWASLVGVVVYMLLAYGLARLVELMYAPARPTVTH